MPGVCASNVPTCHMPADHPKFPASLTPAGTLPPEAVFPDLATRETCMAVD